MQKHCVLFFSLVLFSSCGIDRAVVSPWQYAPPTSSSSWNQKPIAEKGYKDGEKIAKRLLPVALPDQEDPLTLAELIDIALKNNYDTKETWALARSAAAAYAQSQQNFFPNVTSNATFDRARSLAGASSSGTSVVVDSFGNVISSTTTTSAQSTSFLSTWGPQLVLSYLILDFGQTRATSQAALQALYNANLKHNREVQTVIQNTTSDYYNYLYQLKLLESFMQDVADAQTTLNAASASLRAGVQNLSDVLQARSQLLQNQTQLVNQKQAVQTAASTLLTDMGLPAHIQLHLEKMPDCPRVFEIMASVNELISLALQERSDLLASEADLRSKQKTLLAARRALLPTVNGVFNVGRTYYRGTGIPGTINDGYDFEGTLTFTWNLFNGFYSWNTIHKAEADRDYSRAALKQNELVVIEDITNAHSGVAVAREAMRYTLDFLISAEEEYKVALAQYKAGTVDILRVVSAQTSLATARSQRANALQNWFVSLSTLAYAAGVIQRDPRSFLQETSQ